MPEQYTLSLSKAEVDLIGYALGKLPLEQTLTLFSNLKSQVMAQQQATLSAAESNSEVENKKTATKKAALEEAHILKEKTAAA